MHTFIGWITTELYQMEALRPYLNKQASYTALPWLCGSSICFPPQVPAHLVTVDAGKQTVCLKCGIARLHTLLCDFLRSKHKANHCKSYTSLAYQPLPTHVATIVQSRRIGSDHTRLVFVYESLIRPYPLRLHSNSKAKVGVSM